MNIKTNRLTIVTLFEEESINKLTCLLSNIKIPLCKVPFNNNTKYRDEIDTLPLHMTLSSDDISKKEDILTKIHKINFSQFNITIDSIKIMPGRENSYVLYFNVMLSEKLKELHKEIYNILPNKKYEISTYNFHITITIDKNYDNIIKIKEQLEKEFRPIDITIKSIGVYEIYPAKLIKNIK